MRSPLRPRRAVFRLDASPAIGGGHGVRCIALADSLAERAWHSLFVVAEPGAHTIARLAARRHEVRQIPSSAAFDPEALKDAAGADADLLVVDHYGWSATQERACRGWVRTILVIDDLCDRNHDCDVLLDVSLGRTPADYAPLVPTSCSVFTGPGYALLRNEFPRERMAARSPRSESALFVSFGFADQANLCGRALEALRSIAFGGTVDLVLGPEAPHLARVQAAAQKAKFAVRVHVAPSAMATLMSNASVAIGAAGGGAWERCCLGLPSLVVSAAPNQDNNARALAARGACNVTDTAGMESALEHLLRDTTRLTRMRDDAAVITDGRGAARFALTLDPEPTRAGGSVTLRRITPADSRVLLEWQRHPETRRHARNPAVPSAQEHAAWLDRKLADRGCVLDLVLHDGAPAGVVRLDRTAKPGVPIACEVSIYVAPELHGHGIGSAALAALRWLAPEAELIAHVLPGNAVSHALFANAGYEFTDGVYISRPSVGAR